MADESVGPSAAARKVWDTEACLARGRAVRNAMSSAESTLGNPEMPEWMREHAARTIDSAWAALAGHGVGTENKRRLIDAVDRVARAEGSTTLEGNAAGAAVLSRLPPELLLLFAPHREELGHLVAAWRRLTPGRQRSSSSKWAQCAALWERATGETTRADAWEGMWKTSRRRRKSAIEKAAANARRT